jgi:hypothetical protein
MVATNCLVCVASRWFEQEQPLHQINACLPSDGAPIFSDIYGTILTVKKEREISPDEETRSTIECLFQRDAALSLFLKHVRASSLSSLFSLALSDERSSESFVNDVM